MDKFEAGSSVKVRPPMLAPMMAGGVDRRRRLFGLLLYQEGMGKTREIADPTVFTDFKRKAIFFP